MRRVPITPVAAEAGAMSDEELHGIVGGMGGATKLAIARELPGHRPGLFRMTPEVFRRTPAASDCAGGSCRPKSSAWG